MPAPLQNVMVLKGPILMGFANDSPREMIDVHLTKALASEVGASDGFRRRPDAVFPQAAAGSPAKMDPVRDAVAGAGEIRLGKTSGGTVANRIPRAAPTRTSEASERESVGSRDGSP